MDVCAIQRPLDTPDQIRVKLDPKKGQADYFCTCDDQLLKRADRIPDLQVKVINPLHLIEELEK